MKRTRTFWFLVLAWAAVSAGWAEGEGNFTGKVSFESGLHQGPGQNLSLYQYSRLLIESRNDILPSLTLGLSAEGDWQASSTALDRSWPVYPTRNIVNAGADNQADDDGTNSYSLRLSRAFLTWAAGPLEVNAGLRAFDWGSAYFYRPTNYFYPLSPLAWICDQPLGSDVLQASCFLFDFLSAETAVRWLQGGNSEWVARLVNKGIGITVSPSFAMLSGRNGLGLELDGTFPDFQARAEGVDWLYPDGSVQLDWIAGLSTVRDHTTYNLEVFRDGSGQALGFFSNDSFQATYLFASVEKDFHGEWEVFSGLVKALEGGPLMFWPKVSWRFSPSWELGLQGQFMMGSASGPLALNQTRTGVSVSYSF